MTDFEFECAQRKDLARQAKYRKRGSKSKRCSLTTDHMTLKQWKERNGAVMSINLSQPIRNWEVFKSYSKEMQLEYLNAVTGKYHPNLGGLSEMFCVGANAISRHLQAIGFSGGFHRGVRMSKEEREAWQRFLNQEPDIVLVPSDAVFVQPELTPIRAAEPAMRMGSFELVFRGPVDLNAVCNSLRSMYVEGADAELRINCIFPK